MTVPDGVELDHIVLVVADVERSLTWYQEHVRLARPQVRSRA